MSAREISIEQLRLTLPRAHAANGRHDAETFAKSVVAGLATALRENPNLAGSRSVPTLHVEVPRDRADPTGIARAIGKAVADTAVAQTAGTQAKEER